MNNSRTEMREDSDNVAAVVVHHRSYESVVTTVARILSEGVPPNKIVVVDNSEQPDMVASLAAMLPTGVSVTFEANAGYGAAVNRGVRWHVEHQTQAIYLLISTHESLPEVGAVRALREALEENNSAAAAGPLLVTGSSSSLVWSTGGTFTTFLGLPRHAGHKSDRAQLQDAGCSSVSWVDGAFLLFRRAVIEANPIDERFFLYMEETDHHAQLRRQGWQILMEPRAVVWQSSNGIPPYYQTRNIQLFQAKNGNLFQRFSSAPYIILRAIARDLLKRSGTSTWKPLLSGMRAGLQFRMERAKVAQAVHIINPLGAALAHYTNALEVLLRDVGASVIVSSITEPSVSGKGRLNYLARYFKLIAASGNKKNEKTLVVWPVLGFVDLVLAPLLGHKNVSVIYHDPKPLVRSVGTGRATAKIVGLSPLRANVIVHSTSAANEMNAAGLGVGQTVLEHPMVPPTNLSARRFVNSAQPVVRVLGQFKQDRDLDVLRDLATQLGRDYVLEVVGRGWPPITGWTVDSRFVSESELDELIQSSDAIVIPYKRFYQSGIAIRALELGTPIVGRADTSLSGIYGKSSKLLVRGLESEGGDTHAWRAAVEYAVTEGATEAAAAAEEKFAAVYREWQCWISGGQAN
jgi:GT2 family glycosyltransferase